MQEQMPFSSNLCLQLDKMPQKDHKLGNNILLALMRVRKTVTCPLAGQSHMYRSRAGLRSSLQRYRSPRDIIRKVENGVYYPVLN